MLSDVFTLLTFIFFGLFLLELWLIVLEKYYLKILQSNIHLTF